MNTSFYIAELNLPNTSAYTVHVFQMCNALAKKKENLRLLVPFIEKKKIKKIKKNFGIKYDFEIISIFKSNKKLNFFKRLYFAYKCRKKLKEFNKINLILSRSTITGIVLALFKIKTFLEIHTELKGATKYFFMLSKFKFISKNLKFILINKYLLNYFKLSKKNYLILDDAVNTELFKDKKLKRYKKTCAYFGSLTKGKGLELILEISKLTKNINYHVYGDLELVNKNLKLNQFHNIKFFNHVNYCNIPKFMNRYDVLLMPYSKNVAVRSNNLDAGKYMSPLKLFEYLAMSKIIIATKLKVYSHILSNNKNSILINVDKKKLWASKIEQVFKNIKKFDFLKKSALQVSKKFTWDNRVEIILSYNNNFKKLI